ncbi:hypothetical protein PJ985_21895 [Streptomyces sp. ACA25]|uniref:hypothetical protein n=1 Tax=Streptomyces sp. ACA25 TaxID=3022596 RepID=UPI002306EAEF|nr:hypothetical protein [Streptomyces sp. ACA25]MDB1090209.1 hypothetical protein [Streptomyces sp. ACA25]
MTMTTMYRTALVTAAFSATTLLGAQASAAAAGQQPAHTAQSQAWELVAAGAPGNDPWDSAAPLNDPWDSAAPLNDPWDC